MTRGLLNPSLPKIVGNVNFFLQYIKKQNRKQHCELCIHMYMYYLGHQICLVFIGFLTFIFLKNQFFSLEGKMVVHSSIGQEPQNTKKNIAPLSQHVSEIERPRLFYRLGSQNRRKRHSFFFQY